MPVDPTQIESQQLQERSAASLEDVMRVFIRSALASMHVCTPAIVQAIDTVKRTLSVQPVTPLVTAKGFLNLPLLVDVPVVFAMGSGAIRVTPTIAVGDEVLVMFADRCIDRWWTLGGVQPPDEYRMHDLSDGMAIPGLSSQVATWSAWDPTALQISTPTALLGTVTSAGVLTWEGDMRIKGNVTVDGSTTVQSLHAQSSVTIDGTALVQGMNVRTHVHAAGLLTYTLPGPSTLPVSGTTAVPT